VNPGAFNVPSHQAAEPVHKSLLGFPGRECRGIPELTHPSFALSPGGSFWPHSKSESVWWRQWVSRL